MYQIKSFTSGSLTSSRKSQVKKSLESAKTIDPPISEWHLVTPMNPTESQEEWFKDEIQDNAPFVCVWDHRPFCDTLAAEHPMITDYFFDEGANRYADMYRQFRTISDGLIPADPNDAIAVLHTLSENLNQLSIFYRFDLETYPPDIAEQRFEESSKHGDVAFGYLQIFETNAVALLARPLYPQAVEDDRLQLSMTVDPVEVRDAELASRPGEAFEFHPASVADTIGLAEHGEGSTARVTPHPVEIQLVDSVTLRVTSGESEVTRLELSKAIRWPGVTLDTTSWTNENEEVAITLRKQHSDPAVEISFRLDLEGRTALAARPIARLLRAASVDGAEFGLFVGEHKLVALSDHPEIRDRITTDATWFEAIDLIATLSAEADALPAVPDPHVCHHDLQDLRNAVDLLRGRPVPTNGVDVSTCLPKDMWRQLREQHDQGGSYDFVLQVRAVNFVFHVIEEPISIEGCHLHLRRYDFDFEADHNSCSEGERRLTCTPTATHRTVYHLDNGDDGEICSSLPINQKTW